MGIELWLLGGVSGEFSPLVAWASMSHTLNSLKGIGDSIGDWYRVS